MTKLSKGMYYLDIAETVAKRSTCLRKHYGAIIVVRDEIIATGYNGAPRGCPDCTQLKDCYRKLNNIPAGTQYEACRSVHAEANAIISAARSEMQGATLYLVGIDVENNGSYVENITCCDMCKRLIINAGISDVIYRTGKSDYHIEYTCDWVNQDWQLQRNNFINASSDT